MSDPSLNDLVDAHRSEVHLSDEQRTRSRARLLAQVGAGAAVTTVASGVAAHGITGLFAKVTIGLALAGVAGGAYYAARSQPAAPSGSAPSLSPNAANHRTTPASAPTVDARQASEAAPPLEPAPLPEAAPLPAQPVPAPKPSTPKRSSLADEVKTMQEVDGALRSGDASRALTLLERAGPSEAQSLQEERAAARIFALCKLGRFAEGRAEAARFVARWSRSPLAARVKSSCVSD